MYQEDHDRIRARAHHIWEREGKPEGRAEAHWDMAREEIAIEDNQNSATLPNPAAGGKEFAGGAEDAEPLTAAETGFADMPGASNQGDNPPYAFTLPSGKTTVD
jgi:hypothetical protein